MTTRRSVPLSPSAPRRSELLRAPATLAHAVAMCSLPRSEDLVPTARKVQAALIYAVDDANDVTELYTILLNQIGYNVRAFNDRTKALAAFATESVRPGLLITDYVGTSMPIDEFIKASRIVHPGVRILMASGYDEPRVPLASIGADLFIKKPFTPDELLQLVSELMPLGAGGKSGSCTKFEGRS